MNAEKRSIPPKVLLQLLAAVTCSVAVVLLPLNVKAAENNVLPAISSTEQQSDAIANGKENGILECHIGWSADPYHRIRCKYNKKL